MNLIKVPYMPFDSFKSSEEFLQEELEVSNENENPFLETDNVKNLSEELLLIIHGMGMEKYIDLFDKRRILLDTFLKLDETDLKELGINDPDDIKTILKKLGTKQTSDSEFIVNENHIEDLHIAKNVWRQLVLLQHYSYYVELQMKKNKLTDYRVDSTDFASLYMKAFTEGALIQAQILSGRVYDEYSDAGLIDKILGMYNLTLPAVHQEKLPKKKKKKKKEWSFITWEVVTVMSLSSFIVMIGKYLMRLC